MDAALETRLRAFIAEGSGLDPKWVIKANQSGRLPANAFATVLLIDDKQTGLASIVPAGLTATDRFEQQRRALYSVQFFDGRDEAIEFVTWLETDLARFAEERGGFRIGREIEVRQVDAVVDATWETRLSLELSLCYTAVVDQDVGNITAVPWSVSRLRTTARGTVNA